jgi:1-acyl-sn-glycerol-3-phosphate acyltransferase
MRAPIALWRLSLAIVHLLHGLAILELRFGRFTREQREARIQWWSVKLLRTLGLEVVVDGQPPAHVVRTLVVSNHVSWLDFAAIHAVLPQAHFVAKADVLKWPLIGSLVAGAGTLFIERERKRDAIRVVHHMAEALDQGQAVAVFPEATTNDGTTLLPFHANLFQAAITTRARVLPLALRYADSLHASSPDVTFVGETTLLQSMWRIAAARDLRVTVTQLPVIELAAMDRRATAKAARESIASVLGDLGDA